MYFYSNYNQFGVVENSQPIVNKLNRCNERGSAKRISTYDFSTLYTKIPHDDLISVLNKIIDLAFKGGNKNKIEIAYTKAFWVRKLKGKVYFTKPWLKAYLVTNVKLGIHMGSDPVPFWANLYLHFYENKHMLHLIKNNTKGALEYHGSKRFIDDLSAINDSGEFGRFFS